MEIARVKFGHTPVHVLSFDSWIFGKVVVWMISFNDCDAGRPDANPVCIGSF
jgi:hypothetical protein